MVDYPKDHWKQVFRTDPFILKVLEVLRAHGKKADIIESRPVLIVEGPKIILKNDPAVNLGCGDGEQVMREISPFLVHCVGESDRREKFLLFETTGTAERFHRRQSRNNTLGRVYASDDAQPLLGGQLVIGRFGPTKQMWDLLERLAKTGATILLEGESGSGKEVAARFVHINSERSEGPFVPISCAALPPTLIESELFGHEKGAFTGAIATRPGAFERAHQGTLFLDEIGELPLLLQPKLLRIIQEGSFERVGGTRPIKVDVRLITATNKNLKQEVREGKFRQDLYYRISVVPITMPPLRERKADIPALVAYFMEDYAMKWNFPSVPQVGEKAIAILIAHSWPGNIRELENLVQRILAVHGNKMIISPEDLQLDEPADSNPIADVLSGKKTLYELTTDVILQTLDKMNGNRTHTAKALGVNVRTVRNHLRKVRSAAEKKGDTPETTTSE